MPISDMAKHPSRQRDDRMMRRDRLTEETLIARRLKPLAMNLMNDLSCPKSSLPF